MTECARPLPSLHLRLRCNDRVCPILTIFSRMSSSLWSHAEGRRTAKDSKGRSSSNSTLTPSCLPGEEASQGHRCVRRGSGMTGGGAKVEKEPRGEAAALILTITQRRPPGGVGPLFIQRGGQIPSPLLHTDLDNDGDAPSRDGRLPAHRKSPGRLVYAGDT